MSPRIAVLQFPGVNGEDEAARAIQRVGLEAGIVRWNAPPASLAAYDGYLLPGGFSWQDRVRAGALAAKSPLMDVLATEAERGKPVLGLCNGAQVLVEAGLVPGAGEVQLALAANRMPERTGYHARWIEVRVERSNCLFTRHLEPGTVVPMPVAHGEGRFTGRTAGTVERLLADGCVPLRYAGPDGGPAEQFPDNPNGSEAAAAGVCNAAGNVLAMMPHPERAQDLGQMARALGGPWSDARDAWQAAGGTNEPGGPGLVVFEGLARHLGVGVTA
ncbi:MAG TPA: phosphoribosylformylglycinamidine synthase I [Candidatus Eisenbacteria bacterium]|nr:phosphoribosylformylglycinamidine synthase I [Candidatus Eisenbacteria bacterium]